MSQFQTENEHYFDELDKRYDAVGRHIKKLVDGVNARPLILEGPAGVGKTTMVRNFMEKNNHKRYEVVAGKITPMALFIWLHRFRGKTDILVLDDTDTTLENIDALNILKAATDTAKRTISWITSRPLAGLPLQFETAGSVIILSNGTFNNSTRSKKYEHLKAIMSRSLHMEISNDNLETKFVQLCYMVFRHGMLSHHTKEDLDTLLTYLDDRKTSGNPFKQFDLRTAVKLSEIFLEEPDTWRDTADVLL